MRAVHSCNSWLPVCFVFNRCSQVDVHIICSPENDALANEYCDRIRNPAGPFGVALEQGWVSILGCNFT